MRSFGAKHLAVKVNSLRTDSVGSLVDIVGLCSIPNSYYTRCSHLVRSEISQKSPRFVEPISFGPTTRSIWRSSSNCIKNCLSYLFRFLARGIRCWTRLGPYEAKQEKMDCQRDTSIGMARCHSPSSISKLDPKPAGWKDGQGLFFRC